MPLVAATKYFLAAPSKWSPPVAAAPPEYEKGLTLGLRFTAPRRDVMASCHIDQVASWRVIACWIRFASQILVVLESLCAAVESSAEPRDHQLPLQCISSLRLGGHSSNATKSHNALPEDYYHFCEEGDVTSQLCAGYRDHKVKNASKTTCMTFDKPLSICNCRRLLCLPYFG